MKKCGDCLLRRQHGGVMCPLFQEKVNDNDPACRKYIGYDSEVCHFCRSYIAGKPEIVVMNDAEGHVFISCPSCADKLGTCATCGEVHCYFETSPIDIPKQIPRVIRQGNMQVQTIVRNPEREKETCMKGCACWDEENYVCKRQYDTCQKWRVLSA